PVRRRLLDLGLEARGRDRLMEDALADPGWRALAALDASARTVEAVLRGGGLRRGREGARVLERFLLRVRESAAAETPVLPAEYWSVRAAPPGPEGEERLRMRGAVLVRIAGRHVLEPAAPAGPSASSGGRAP